MGARAALRRLPLVSEGLLANWSLGVVVKADRAHRGKVLGRHDGFAESTRGPIADTHVLGRRIIGRSRRFMPEFVIEREIPGAGSLSSERLDQASRASLAVLRDLGPGIRWLRSFVTNDKIYCVYFATSAELIREHATRLGIPANRIEMVRTMLDPADFEE